MNKSEAHVAVSGTAGRGRRVWKSALFIVVCVTLMKVLLMYLHGQISYRESMYKWAITSCHAHQGTWVDAPPPAQYEGACR